MTIATRGFPNQPVKNYARFRTDIASGDLLLCSGPGFFSRMIRAGTKSVWSHVGFVMQLDEIDRVMVLESVEPLGVRTVPLSKYLNVDDSLGNPYPGRTVIARHDDFSAKAQAEAVAQVRPVCHRLVRLPLRQGRDRQDCRSHRRQPSAVHAR